jgi:hypothetical protein
MKGPILCLRVSRRAAAGVVLADERLSFFDGRHLRSNTEAALRGVARYIQLLLEQARPATVVLDCPSKSGSSTTSLAEAVKTVTVQAGATFRNVDAQDVCGAFGSTSAVTRLQMRAAVEEMFDQLSEVRGKVKPFIVDAAAVALFAESGSALGTFDR